MPRSVDKGVRADDDGANGGAEAFAEAERDAVEVCAVSLQSCDQRVFGVVVFRGGRCGDGFPEAGAVEVEVYGWGLGARPGGDGGGGGEGEDGACEGVFEADEAGRAGMDVGGGDGVGFDIAEGEVVFFGRGDGDREGAREAGEAACFPNREIRLAH